MAPTGRNSRSFQAMISETSPHRLEPVDHAIGESGDLDAEVPHDLGAANLKSVLEVQDRAPIEHGRECVTRFENRRLALDRLGDPGRRDQAADDALAIIGLEPVDSHGVVRQPFPDRQQQAGDDMQAAVSELRYCGDFSLPRPGEIGPIGFLPMGPGQCTERDCGSLHRPEQTDAAFDFTVIQHQAGRRHLDGSAPGLSIHQQPGTRIIARPD